MAKLSQTTGYAAKSIYLTQYSTAGQHLVASSGAEIDIEGGAKLEVCSGGDVDVVSGGFLTLSTGAKFRRQDVEIITSSKDTLSVQGISVIKSTVKGDYQLPQP